MLNRVSLRSLCLVCAMVADDVRCSYAHSVVATKWTDCALPIDRNHSLSEYQGTSLSPFSHLAPTDSLYDA